MSDLPSASNSPASSPVLPDDTITRLRDEANAKAREFESSEPLTSLKDQARSAVSAVGDEASNLAGDLKSRAIDYAETGKRTGADRLSSLAGAVERAASELERESPETARFIQQAAQSTQRFSSKIRDRSVNDLVADARDVARRQPVLVFGGAIVAGLVLARFFKSSTDDVMARSGARRDTARNDVARNDAGRNYGGSHDYE